MNTMTDKNYFYKQKTPLIVRVMREVHILGLSA